MSIRIVVDIETSGLTPEVNQVLEVAMVKVVDGVVMGDTKASHRPLHFYVEWDRVTYDVSALKRFGDRITDRKEGVRIADVSLAGSLLRNFIIRGGGGRQTMLGKNIGRFDTRFLLQLWPGMFDHVHYRLGEITEKYEHRHDFNYPDLEMCRLRAAAMGCTSPNILKPVAHTALDDAMLTAELYAFWYNTPHDKWVIPERV